MKMEDIRGAVARGWCHEGNTHKEMDVVLAEAISEEVSDLLLEDKTPYLGCATTRELIQELAARASNSETLDNAWLDYRTVD